MNPATGLCEGCLRTIEEIAAWGSADTQRKTGILQEVARRRAQLAPEPMNGTRR